MQITKEAFAIIKEGVGTPAYEIGGIIGSSDGEVIDKVIMDNIEAPPQKACSYRPNTEYLNKQIARWQDDGIEFRGVFHSHFAEVKTLSNGDIKYINEIIMAMPDSVKYLYFPLYVLPSGKLVGYRAEIARGETIIGKEEITVV